MYSYSRQLYFFQKYVDDSGVEEGLAQRELDNFWEREKSNKEVGTLYERYIGYLYEDAGYHVEYSGILRGVKDMGRDLVCRFGNEVRIVQCKNWGYDKVVYVKHIHQLHGTLCHYKKQYPNRCVYGVFFTTSRLSFNARAAADRLKIETHEHFLMKGIFPIIKCKAREKKYYLPDDWDFDRVEMILTEGDCYCTTVKEAEEKGFKRV